MVPTELIERTAQLLDKCKSEYTHLPLYKEVLKLSKEYKELTEGRGTNG
jgi:hypothetical protein